MLIGIHNVWITLHTVNNPVHVPKIYFFLLTKTISGFLPTQKWVDHTHCSGRELNLRKAKFNFGQSVIQMMWPPLGGMCTNLGWKLTGSSLRWLNCFNSLSNGNNYKYIIKSLKVINNIDLHIHQVLSNYIIESTCIGSIAAVYDNSQWTMCRRSVHLQQLGTTTEERKMIFLWSQTVCSAKHHSTDTRTDQWHTMCDVVTGRAHNWKQLAATIESNNVM